MSQKRWDQYYLNISKVVASNSRCLSRQVGAILVFDKVVVATGYNGPPRGVSHCLGDICPRRQLGFSSGEGLHLCPAAHAETNCIYNAARVGVQTLDTTMYMTCGVPCKECLKGIINAGIKELVCTSLDHYDLLSGLLLRDSSLVIRTYETED